jgi:urease accessory protein
MRQATKHQRAGNWPADNASDSVTLDFDARHRRRIRMITDGGEDILLNLPKAAAMADGDGLQLNVGTWLAVRAAEEQLMEIRCASQFDFVRVTWHLGNRHLPTEILADCLRIRPDHVIEEMVKGLGADVHHIEARFQPEGGAYGEHGHGGGQGHQHD